MKKRCLLLLTVCLPCLFIGAYTNGQAAEETSAWVYYGKTGYGDYYYDKNSLAKVGPQVIKVGNKIKYSEDGRDRALRERKAGNQPLAGWERLDYTLSFNELNCLKKTIRTVKVTDFNDQGKIIEDFDFERPQTEQIIPESMNDSLLKLACPK